MKFIPLSEATQEDSGGGGGELTFVPLEQEPTEPPAPTPAVTQKPKVKSDFAPGEEFATGAKGAFQVGLPTMLETGKLSGWASALSETGDRLKLLDAIDRGEIKNPRSLRSMPGFAPQVGMYFASNPEVRQKIRTGEEEKLVKLGSSTAESLAIIEAYKQQAQKYKGRVDDPFDAENITDFTNWMARTMGSGAVYAVPVLAAAFTTKQPGLLATGVGMGYSEAVGNRLDALAKDIQKLPSEQKARRVADYLKQTDDVNVRVAVASGALDTILGPAASLARRTAQELIKSQTKKEVLKQLPKEVVKQAGEEFVAGTGQAAAQERGKVAAGEKKEFLTRETLKEAIKGGLEEAFGSVPATSGIGAVRAAVAPSAPEAAPLTEEEKIEPTLTEELPPAPPSREPTLKFTPLEETQAEPAEELRKEPTLTFTPLAQVEEGRIEPVAEPEKIEPAATLPEAAPAAEVLDVDPVQVEALAANLQQTKGYTGANARRIATARLRREATERAQEMEVAPAEAIEEGAPDVGETITSADREGVPVVGQPSAVPTTPRAGEPVTDGVVLARPDVAAVAEGKRVQPSAVTAEEPKKEGFVRVYHSGAKGEGDSGRWVSTDKKYASGYRPNLPLFYTDIPANDPRVNNPDYPEQSAEQGFTFNFELTPQEATQLKEIARETAPTELMEEVPKKPAAKRGRKAVALTEEEKAAKTAAVKEYKRKYSKGVRDYDRAGAELILAATPINESEIENEDALKEAQAEKRAQLVSGIRNLLSVEKNYRGTPLGNKAKALLNDRTKISQKDYNDIKQGWEATQQSKSLASSRAKPNPLLKGRMSAAQVLTAIGKSGTPFERMLGARIRSALQGVNVYVVEKGDPVPSRIRLADNFEAWDRARGVYMAADTTGPREVYLRGASFGLQNGTNNVTALHELLHAALNHRIGAGLLGAAAGKDEAKLVKLTRELSSLMDNARLRYEQLERAGVLSPRLQNLVEATLDVDPETLEAGYEIFELPQEFLAYGLSDPVFQEFLMSIEGRRTDESAFSRFVRSILQFLGLAPNQFTALSDLINITDDMLGAHTADLVIPSKGRAFRAAQEPEEPAKTDEDLEEEWKRVNEIHKKSVESTKFRNRGVAQKTKELANPVEVMNWVKSFWPLATKAQREVIARLPSMPFLGDWAKDAGLPHIKEASDLMTAAIGSEKVLQENTEQLIFMLKRAFKADPTLQDKLTALIYKSTNAKIDPSDPNATRRSEAADQEFEDLGPEGQRLYVLVKEHYEDRGDLFLQLLEDNLEYMGLEPDTKKNLIAVLRKTYEGQNRIQPYFPFVREDGKYWLSVGKGGDKEFYIYESMRDRDADRARIIRERGVDPDDTSIGNNIDSLRTQVYEASSLIRETFDAIDKATIPTGETEESHAQYKEALKDAIYQGYLNVMPEKSFRGMFKARKGLAGYRTDLIQNIAAVDGKMNHQLAKLEYSQQLRNVVESAQSAIDERPELQPFVDELRRRVDAFLIPSPHNWADVLAGTVGRVGFTYLLSGLSLPILQPIALFTSGLSTIWGNYKTNPATAGAALLNAYANLPQYGVVTTLPDGTKRYNWPSLVNSTKLTDDERQAMREFSESGMHESTLAREIWDHAGKPTSSFVKEPGKEAEYYAARTMKGIDTVIGSPFHIVERWTRESMFLAAYRIGRDKRNNLSHEEAVKKSIDSLKEALGDYSQSAKPRWMQRGLGKMAFALKTFPVLMLQQIVGNLIRAIPILNKEGKIAAIKKFSGLMITTGLVAGASGVPLATIMYSMAAGIILALQGDDKDPYESEEEAELRNSDRGMWLRHVWLPKHIPDMEISGVKLYDWIDRGVLNAITGLDFASRLQVATVWGPDIEKPAKTPMEAATNLAVDYLAGAYYSMIEQFLKAYNFYSLGDKQKASELASPKFIRDYLKGDRYEKEGFNINGKEVLAPGNLTALELWGQRLGFTPDIIAITQKQGIAGKSIVEKTQIEAKRLIDKLEIADRKNSPEGDAEFDRIMDTEVEKFNEKHPDFELTEAAIKQSLRLREKIRDNSEAGVTVNKKEADALAPLLDRMNKRLEDREAKMRKKAEQ